MLIRDQAMPKDIGAVREIVRSTGFFYESEIDIAVELVSANLARGAQASGYYFLFADDGQGTQGYSCYGPIDGTVASFDLYWIAVRQEQRGKGIGALLMQASEQRIAEMGGKRIYVETSSRAQYEPTRLFYKKHHYLLEATLEEFYGPGDGKQFWVKVLAD